ncbi:hypothetical protein niasHT_021789 [Heterodera trifolii]|uniref:Protein RFT1 homolog n=1 Tax=Heterodera trifolii TaxID=157864 RepID=A0ABD2J8J1_9BILA
MDNFASVYRHMLAGQLVIRLVSFLLNFALLRLVDPSLLGFFNVKMTLLYTTICFLSREPIRRLCLSSDFPLHKVPLYASLSPLFALATISLCFLPWVFFGVSPPSELAISRPTNALIVALFALSALAETFAEPSIVCQLKMGNIAEYAKNNAILVFSQKAIAFFAVLFGMNPLFVFPVAQLLGSLLFVWLHRSLPFSSSSSSSSNCFLFSFASLRLFDSSHLHLLGTFLCHSLLKQSLTDGANYLMSFTDLLPLKVQAIYDAVERLGSLVVRLVLQPFEESAAIYFGTQIRRSAHGKATDEGKRRHSSDDGNTDAHSSNFAVVPPISSAVPSPICAEFLLLTRLIVTLGFVLSVFGSSFCWLAAFLYGGQLFVDNGADLLLFWYSVYLPLIAVNGISECFVIATLNASQLLLHARFFLLLSLFLHLPLSYALCSLFGALGFVFANLAVYSLRVLFNWYFLRPTLCAQFDENDNDGQKMARQSQKEMQMYRQLLPGKKFSSLLLFTLLVLSISRFVLGQTLTIPCQFGHLILGALLFCLNAFAFFVWECKPSMLDFGEKKSK